ncbi:hypothetical protein K435DRAFT_864533 [Dendrothele bispora CBS 962.96]|uniref:Uncharacterized protein n=1 Tax=Dendrothele bispora (strain CBS 962.96) TaxID=1314807 RepID=A0A4S8LN69_DENBC|nr:hypothetical protein K435DRAFT_864533 [Dendrothele bispora CBS 962.96]
MKRAATQQVEQSEMDDESVNVNNEEGVIEQVLDAEMGALSEQDETLDMNIDVEMERESESESGSKSQSDSKMEMEMDVDGVKTTKYEEQQMSREEGPLTFPWQKILKKTPVRVRVRVRDRLVLGSG